MLHEKILILDFGAQYTQLIARRVREASAYCEIHPFDVDDRFVRNFKPRGIILSGGPASVWEGGTPRAPQAVFDLGVPVLGICYGMQTMAAQLGGKVEMGRIREFGYAEVRARGHSALLKDLQDRTNAEGHGLLDVWMSHGDKVDELPAGFKVIASSTACPIAAMADEKRRFYGVQFHPEVTHTPQGKALLERFVLEICGLSGDWSMPNFIEEATGRIRSEVGAEEVVLGLSGGVDSSVAAALTHRAIGDQLTCIFVDNGLLRSGEKEQVKQTFAQQLHLNLRLLDASDSFLAKLKGVIDPERKRKIIGKQFIEQFEAEAKKKSGGAKFLVQGTLYPDVIESVSFKGPSATIKTHHNVGGLPARMKLKLIEPLRELFKDEVRVLGKELGLPDEIVWRQPFPGPGLAIRVLGAVTRERLAILRAAETILDQEIRAAGLYREIWQSLAVLLPIRTVGVMGDQRTYEHVVALRAVTSLDGMTADWAKIPNEVLGRISNRIINEVKGVNRVVYDISSKPPATIEWE